MTMTMAAADKKRTSKGKQKITINKIDKLQSRHVAFSKRRAGLFKKCAELHSRFGAEVAAVTFSIAGKPMSCAYPSSSSTEAVLQRYIRDSSSSSSENPQVITTFVDHHQNQNQNQNENQWWETPVDNLGLEELDKFKSALEGLNKEIVSRVDEMSRNQEAEIRDDLGCLDAQVETQSRSVVGNAPELVEYNCQETQPADEALDLGWIDEFLGSHSELISESSFPAAADGTYLGMIGCC